MWYHRNRQKEGSQSFEDEQCPYVHQGARGISPKVPRACPRPWDGTAVTSGLAAWPALCGSTGVSDGDS